MGHRFSRLSQLRWAPVAVAGAQLRQPHTGHPLLQHKQAIRLQQGFYHQSDSTVCAVSPSSRDQIRSDQTDQIRSDQIRSDQIRSDQMGWDGMGWDGMGWDGMGWDGMGWDGMGWDGMGWDGMGWDGMGWGPPPSNPLSHTPQGYLTT